jgi:P27 family predicted phage terminase small subunit
MKGRTAISNKLNAVDNTASKQSIAIPSGQPKHITRLFRQILSQLNGIQLCEQDTHAILLLAKNLNTIADADKALDKGGMVLTTKSGYVQPNPYIAIRNKAQDNALKLLRQLGMTPAARLATRAKPTSETQDELEAFNND